MRVLMHEQRPLITPKEVLASGFDFPTTLVGVSNWKGSDGKPVTVYYDAATGPVGLSVAKYILSKIDDLMASCDVWFGIRGQGGNVVIAPNFGGAYHYGCDFTSGGTWYESLSSNETTLGLVMAEVTESYMGLQNKGWNCGGSGGEALSRVLAEVATGGASGAMSAYSSGPSWDGTDWISKDQGTDQNYPSIGCGVLYLWWLLKQGFTLAQIIQAGEPNGTLATNYERVTGTFAAAAFANFKVAVAVLGPPSSFQNDNPFNAPNPPYPATGPTPPPPPPPPQPPGGTMNIQLTGHATLFGINIPIILTGTGIPSASAVDGGHAISIPPWLLALLHEACTLVGGLPAPWNFVLGFICGLLPPNAHEMAAAGQPVSITLPVWLTAFLRFLCMITNNGAGLPAPFPPIVAGLCSLIPAQAALPCGGCK